MKRNLFVIFLILFVLFLGIKTLKAKVGSDFAQPVYSPSVTPTPSMAEIKGTEAQRKTSLFVPYWSASEVNTGEYDDYLYFGVAPSANGHLQEDDGKNNVESFVAAVPATSQKLLVVRMLDKDTVSALLQDENRQKTLIAESLSLAKEQGFSGVVLDLEISAIPLDSVVNQITRFNHNYYTQAKAEKLLYGMTLYGDTFYRLRPFDIKALSKQADMFFVMAYDFHKAQGEPGPNFPLTGSKEYGYDLGSMADDFLRHIPANKLIITFGLYGYDWEVDNKGEAISAGKALSYRDIDAGFLSNCQYTNCVVKRDPVSLETKISYTDEDKQKHIIWFEDMQSVTAKEKMLYKKGIGSFSFWANGYF